MIISLKEYLGLYWAITNDLLHMTSSIHTLRSQTVPKPYWRLIPIYSLVFDWAKPKNKY